MTDKIAAPSSVSASTSASKNLRSCHTSSEFVISCGTVTLNIDPTYQCRSKANNLGPDLGLDMTNVDEGIERRASFGATPVPKVGINNDCVNNAATASVTRNGIIIPSTEASAKLKVLCFLWRTTGELMLPKGRKHVHESLHAAALRETYEETGHAARLLPLPVPTLADGWTSCPYDEDSRSPVDASISASSTETSNSERTSATNPSTATAAQRSTSPDARLESGPELASGGRSQHRTVPGVPRSVSPAAAAAAVSDPAHAVLSNEHSPSTSTQATRPTSSLALLLTPTVALGSFHSEPVAVTQRMHRGALKMVFWFAAYADESVCDTERPVYGHEAEFETVWVEVEDVAARVSFEDDRRVIGVVVEAWLRLTRDA